MLAAAARTRQGAAPGALCGSGRLAAALRLQAAALGHARELRAPLMRAGAWGHRHLMRGPGSAPTPAASAGRRLGSHAPERVPGAPRTQCWWGGLVPARPPPHARVTATLLMRRDGACLFSVNQLMVTR